MLIVAVDNNKYDLKALIKHIDSRYPKNKVICFSNAIDAYEFGVANRIDILYTEVQMNQMSGFTLTQKLLQMNRDMKVVFVSSTPDYAIEAFSMHAEDYLLKPL